MRRLVVHRVRRSAGILAGVVMLLSGMLAACGERLQSTVPADSPSTGSGESRVLVRVNDSPITETDLDRAIATNLGAGATRLLSDEAKANLLESLIVSRVMAQEVEPRLGEKELAEVEAMTRVYRENLLAREFVRLETQSVELSEAMAKEYYAEHPDLFGAGTVRHYQLLRAPAVESEDERKALIEMLGGAPREDFPAFARRPEARALGITYREGDLVPGLFAPRLHQLLASLDEGQASNVIHLEGVAYRGRVASISSTPPRPFAEVRVKAFERLKASRLKQELARLRAELLSRSAIEYVAGEASSVDALPIGATFAAERSVPDERVADAEDTSAEAS